MWVYPIDLVYNFYHIASTNEQRHLSVVANLARITAYTARDLTKEGSKEVEKLWSEFMKPLSGSSKKGATPATQKAGMKTGNRAADAMFSVGRFQAVKSEPSDGTAGA